MLAQKPCAVLHCAIQKLEKASPEVCHSKTLVYGKGLPGDWAGLFWGCHCEIVWSALHLLECNNVLSSLSDDPLADTDFFLLLTVFPFF